MNTYRLARETGDLTATADLPREYIYHLYHSIEAFPNLLLQRRKIPKHSAGSAGVNSLAIEKFESRYMLSGHVDSSIDLWDLTHPPINLSYEPDSLALIKPITTVPRESPENHKYAISGINFFPFDSGLFTSSSYDKSVKVWDTNSLSVAGSFDVEAPIWAHAFSPVAEHCLIACAAQSSSVRLIDLKSGGFTHSLIGHGRGCHSVAWSPRDEYILASGSADGTCQLWDIRQSSASLAFLDSDNSPERTRSNPHNKAHLGPVNGISWTDDGNFLVTVGCVNEHKMRVWDMNTGRNTLVNFGPWIRRPHQHTQNPVIVPLKRCEPTLVFVVSKDEVLGFDLFKGTLMKQLKARDDGGVRVLAARPNGVELYSGSTTGKITLWAANYGVDEEDDIVERAEQANILKTISDTLTRAPVTFT